MAIIERYLPPAEEVQGVALVVHGLNLKPNEMRFLVEHLTEAGIEVIVLTLRGHGENFAPVAGQREHAARVQTFAEVTHREWMEEVYAAYQIARLRSECMEKPLFLSGFSLGGLLLCELLMAYPDTHADRMLLLAPALRLRRTSRIVRWLFPFPKLGIPSLAPRRYQSNWVTTVAGYRAMFVVMSDLDEHLRGPYRAHLNLPTLVLMHEWDELVSYHGIQRLIQEHLLDQWRLIGVDKGGDSKVLSNHPVFDPVAVGTAPWTDMMELALDHLLEREPSVVE